MKKLLMSLIILVLLFSACTKKDETCDYIDSSIIAPDTEVQNLQTYLDTNGITATKHPSGFFYKINAQGSGSGIVNLCSVVTVKYKGRLTNGFIFDSTATDAVASFTLGGLILSWQKGIPLISKGGKITLYVPPSLGYGSQPAGTIPANSILIFDIELVDIQ